jgi:hypothetical protein
MVLNLCHSLHCVLFWFDSNNPSINLFSHHLTQNVFQAHVMQNCVQIQLNFRLIKRRQVTISLVWLLLLCSSCSSQPNATILFYFVLLPLECVWEIGVLSPPFFRLCFCWFILTKCNNCVSSLARVRCKVQLLSSLVCCRVSSSILKIIILISSQIAGCRMWFKPNLQLFNSSLEQHCCSRWWCWLVFVWFLCLCLPCGRDGPVATVVPFACCFWSCCLCWSCCCCCFC